MGGFLQMEEFDQITAMICKRGIWESAYLQFLEEACIDLPEQINTKFWNYMNEGEPNPGLVPIAKIIKELEIMIYSSGMIPEVLITTVSLMGVRVPEAELRFIHAMFDYNANGFMAFDDLYELLDKLGRRGMPFARFKASVQGIGLKVDQEEVYEVFSSLDVNQDAQLDWAEFKGGMLTIVREKMPQAILIKLGMSEMDIIKKVTIVVFGMATLFAFILLALQSFGGGKTMIASIQSSFSTAITMGANSESSGGLDLDKYRNTVTAMIAAAMGLSSVPK